ncbi:hypothetical protein HK101_007924 [Irineochytrium annulatum]|nr:hypothetical protein HK101_007924 [Irineochytrium annulatum]
MSLPSSQSQQSTTASMHGSTPRGLAKKAKVRLPLYVSITCVVFFLTTLLGSIVGYITISKSLRTIDDITSQIRLAILNRASEAVNNTITESMRVLQVKSNNVRVFNFVNSINRGAWMANPEMIANHYQAADPFSSLENSGIVFQADGNGNQSYMAAYPRGQQVYFQDATTDYTLKAAAVLGINADSSLNLNQTFTTVRDDWIPNVKWPVLASNGLTPGQPFWAPPIFTPIFKTFLIPLFWPVWANSSLGTVTSGNYYAAHFVMLSIKSLDTFLQSITVSPNGVVALIDGNTGNMLASSVRGISQNGTTPTTFPAIGNPNNLVSAAATYLATAFSSGDGSIQGIPLSSTAAALSTTFHSGAIGDDVLVNAVWLTNPTTGLKWLLLLAIPSNDFVAVIRATMQQAIIFIVAFCVLALIVAILLSWAITSPLRYLSKAMGQATQFDFSALRDGYLDQRSAVSEIGQLQGAFNEMMIKFASGIEQNKALMLRNGQGKSGLSSHQN